MGQGEQKMIIYLQPKSTFPTLHSDTIFGALCSVLTELYPNFVEELKEDFKEKPAFLISSAFPYIPGKEKKHFLPKIDVFTKNGATTQAMDSFKKYKKIKYFEEDIFLEVIQNKLTSTDIINNISDYKIQSNILMKEDDDISIKQTIKHNNIIHRISDSSLNVYYTEGLQYKNLGVYFIVKIFNEKYGKLIKTGMKLLEDRGFGANITTGQGQFTYIIDENSQLEQQLSETTGNYFLTLSRYIPTKDEIKKIDKYSTYIIGSKRGINSDGELKKRIRFFEEGSTFPTYQQFYGKIVETGTITPSIENGYAFTVNMEVETNEV